jgi:hypothetical protein
VCRALREGVLAALAALMQGFVDAGRTARRRDAGGHPPLPALFEQSLTIVYRILFLLFAEARQLVPTWHPVYREGYSIETLRALAEQPGDRSWVGLWEALQAVSRLAHHGCRAGTLVVTPFNGRLFSPARTPLAESGRLDDRVAREAIVALSTHDAGAGRHRARIAYRDLGVEQLGAVYESVLDYEPRVAITDVVRSPTSEVRSAESGVRSPGSGVRSRPSDRESSSDIGHRTSDGSRGRHKPSVIVHLEKGSGRRKATGTFYTPQSLTGYLVRRTLHPLVEHAKADEILRLRVLDPAMGSGAFLVAACHYLAARYERALVAEGGCHAGEVDERDRAMFRRSIAQRCLFGVDLNPMAVQLGRLSLWLATLAADCPLTFLDHHLASGDSLVGASVFDVLRYPARRAPRPTPHPGLFDTNQLRADLEQVLPERLRIGMEPGDTLAAVKDKERAIRRLARPDGPLARWKAAADLWCACWFWGEATVPPRGVYRDLVDALVGRRTSLPEASASALIAHAREVASARRFLHWQIEFPEVFFDDTGGARPNAGFDAIIGNPPWDMLRADREGAGAADDKAYDRALVGFARNSGFYAAQSDGHPNRFQLFVERALGLARPGGRVGLVVPWGLVADRGCSGLRRLLFQRADTDSLVGFENTKAIFPIHRSVRFALLTTTTGRPTARTWCRFGERDVATLDGLPDASDEGGRGASYPIVLSPALLSRVSGDDLAVPDIRSPLDLQILEAASSSFPSLSAPDGWGAHFGRELNASDDRQHFVETGRGLPIVEGKHIEPFVAHVAHARVRIPAAVAARLLGGNGQFRRVRLAYRDVASATNRVTLIAALLPRDCVTTHTLFCLKTPLDEDAQWFLCGVMNSYVANYLVRLRVTTHVSAGIVERLPVPFVTAGSGLGREVATLSRQLAARLPGVRDDRLQALVARLYNLAPAQFSHVLATFPLVEAERRQAAFAEFLELTRQEV